MENTDSMEQSENTLTMVGTAAAVHSAAVLLCCSAAGIFSLRKHYFSNPSGEKGGK